MFGKMNRNAYWWLVALVALALSFGWGQMNVAPAQTRSTLAPLALASLGGGGGDGLITHFHDDRESATTRVIVVDPLQRRIAVYHVEMASGKIQLKSVRNMTIDLQVEDYNSGDPSPIDMKKLLQRN